MTDTVQHAETATRAWREAARVIQAERLDHGNMYALGGELSATLRAVEEVVRVLRNQMVGYGFGRRLCDDAGTSPADRLAEAAVCLAVASRHLPAADDAVQRYWSAIGHIGLADTDEPGEG